MKEIHRASYGEAGEQSFHKPSSQYLNVFTNPEALRTLSFRSLNRGLIMQA